MEVQPIRFLNISRRKVNKLNRVTELPLFKLFEEKDSVHIHKKLDKFRLKLKTN